MVVVTKLLSDSAHFYATLLVVLVALGTGLTLLIVNPKRFSVVEGVAGSDGYDELNADDADIDVRR